MRFTRGSTILAAAVAAATGLSGCGGSSSSSPGAATSLDIASKVSVVDTSSGSGASLKALRAAWKTIDPTGLPSGSDYNSDETKVFVEERSAEAFDTVNEILCSLAQSRYDAMLNQGDYKAQIDLAQCSSSNDDAASAGESSKNQSSGSSQPDYEFWTLNSSRADASSPQVVKAWIHQEASENEPEQVIFAKLTITEAVSAANPYGLFTIYFEAHPATNGVADTSTTTMQGFLKSEEDSNGKVLLKFIVDGGFDTDGDGTEDMSFLQKVALDRSGDGTTGGGSTSVVESGPFGSNNEAYTFAFDSSHFLRSDADSNQTCLSRSAYDETAWRYGLYDTDGARVTRNSGFPLKYTSGGSDYFGWIGYWGLWFPESVTIPDGATVYKMSFSGGETTEAPYTVVKAGGKLKKYTKQALTLADIKGIPLQMFDNTTSTDYQLEWNGTGFVRTATLDHTTWLWEDLSPTQTFDITSLNMTELNMWSDALGGNVQIKLDNCAWDNAAMSFSCEASDSSSVIFYLENIVYPTDAIPSTFACMDNCPDPSVITASSPFFDTSSYQNQSVAPDDPSLQYVAYTFDTSSMLLESGGTPVELSSANSNYQWGVTSGPLFEPTAENLAQLACSWDTNNTCAWQARSNLDTFYSWETGVNSWNQFTALSSGGSFLTFEQPLSIKYTRTSGDVTSTYFLQYAGFGELQGIPGKCVDRDTGADTGCGPDTRWIPEFSIPEDTTVVNGSDNTTEYIVKPLEKEQRMQSSSLSSCSGLTLTSYTLPDIADFIDPDIGDEPAVTDAPAVIGGVLQE